jgi:hypothetical protein
MIETLELVADGDYHQVRLQSFFAFPLSLCIFLTSKNCAGHGLFLWIFAAPGGSKGCRKDSAQ